MSNFALFEVSQPQFSIDTFLDFCEAQANNPLAYPSDKVDLNHFTKLNLQRMRRLFKTAHVSVEGFPNVGEQIWYVITEPWCGDSAQNLPYIALLASALGTIDLRIVLRDHDTQLIDKYLTNGGRSIPKLISFNQQGQELFTWGPRPAAAQTLYNNWKNSPQPSSFEDFELDMHKWYTNDKGEAVLAELKTLLS